MGETGSKRTRAGLAMKSMLGAALVALLAVGGCANKNASGEGDTAAAESGQGTESQFRQLASRPADFAIGDSFQYDNPDISWTITSVSTDRLVWESVNGDKQVTSRNPILPALDWESEKTGTGRRLISRVEGGLFPLDEGKEIRFRSTVNTDTPPYAWEFDWHCRVVSREPVEVASGRFDTFRIRCGRQGQDELVFWYAPRVGHYVRMDLLDPNGGETRTRELVAFSRHASAEGVLTAPQMAEESMTADAMASEEAMSEEIMAGDAMAEEAMQADAENETEAETEAETETETKTDTESEAIEAARADAIVANEPSAKAQAGVLAIHLASFKTEAGADTGWERLNEAFPEVLASKKPIIRRTDLGDKGVFYRVYAAPMASREEAEAACREIRARDAYCRIEQF